MLTSNTMRPAGASWSTGQTGVGRRELEVAVDEADGETGSSVGAFAVGVEGREEQEREDVDDDARRSAADDG